MEHGYFNILSLNITGPLRLLILGIVFFGFYFLLPSKNKVSTWIVIPVARLVAISIVFSFFLVQLNAFDRFSVVALLLGTLLWKGLQLQLNRNIWNQLLERKDRILLFWVANVEQDTNVWLLLKAHLNERYEKVKEFLNGRHLFWPLVMIICVTVATYFSRSFFYEFDHYTLSALWQQDLFTLKNIANHNWFNNQNYVLGEYIAIVLYKYLTNISWLSALHTFGLLESAVMAGVLFWFVYKLTGKSIFSALLASLSFAFLYGILFLDLGTLSQHTSILFSLLFFLLAASLLLNPLSISPRKIFKTLFWLFLGIALSNLFVSLVVLPLFFLASVPWLFKKHRKQLLAGFISYIFATGLMLVVYAFITLVKGDSFSVFITNQLYTVSNYTFLPQLLIPYADYMTVLRFSGLLTVVVLLIFWSQNTKKWRKLLSFHSFFGLLLLLTFFENQFFDLDMLNQVITVCSPIFFATSFYSFYLILKSALFRKTAIPVPYKVSFIILFIGGIIVLQKNNFTHVPKGNETAIEVAQAYSQIEQTYIPFSYLVVNLESHTSISKDSHLFIYYDSFNGSYLKIDELFSKRKNDKKFLKEHPEYILPSSTFLFLYKKNGLPTDVTFDDLTHMKAARNSLQILKGRKRHVSVFYRSSNLVVYEIVNKPGEGKITDLLAKNIHGEKE